MIQRPQSDYSTLGPGKLFRPYSQNRTFGAFLLLIGLLRNSLYVEASGGLFVHYIVNHALFGFYI